MKFMSIYSQHFNLNLRLLLILMVICGLVAVRSNIVKAAPLNQTDDGGQTIFEEKCLPCHTIGAGNLVGPDLEGVTERRDRDWLVEWIQKPDEMLARGDPIATQLLQEFNNVPMPNQGLSQSQAEDLLAFLENPGGVISQQTTVPKGDPAVGEAIFLGTLRLKNGAPSCISCHNAVGVGALDGGTLGPDLTNVYGRYGEVGLAATLESLPFPTMQGVFTDKPLTEDEVSDLYAYFIQRDQDQAQPVSFNFVLIGLVGFIILILIGQLVWRNRLTQVRKPMLGGAK